MDQFKFNPVITGIAAIAMLAAVLLFFNRQSLSTELETLRAQRATLERDSKAASERAYVAERAMEEAKTEIDKVKAANEQVNHSVTQLRNQLEQVQIQANTAREDFEKRLKTGADELGKAQGDLQRLGDEAAQARSAKDAAEKQAQAVRDEVEARLRDADSALRGELKKVQDELARERAARESAERMARDGSSGASTGAAPGNP